MSKYSEKKPTKRFFKQVGKALIAGPLFIGQIFYNNPTSNKFKRSQKILICNKCDNANYLIDIKSGNNNLYRKCSHCHSIQQHRAVKATKAKLLTIKKKQTSARQKSHASVRNSSATRRRLK